MPSSELEQDIRQFLKRFGVQADRTIQEAVERALAEGRLAPGDTVPVRAHLLLEACDVEMTIEATLRAGDAEASSQS